MGFGLSPLCLPTFLLLRVVDALLIFLPGFQGDGIVVLDHLSLAYVLHTLQLQLVIGPLLHQQHCVIFTSGFEGAYLRQHLSVLIGLRICLQREFRQCLHDFTAFLFPLGFSPPPVAGATLKLFWIYDIDVHVGLLYSIRLYFSLAVSMISSCYSQSRLLRCQREGYMLAFGHIHAVIISTGVNKN